MVTLEIRFPGRRYHATPWGHHVNEGLVEWPPSPWRILRALLATGYSKLAWREGELPQVAVALLEKLASVVPEFELPGGVTVAHSRHYMPSPVKTTLVFDTWAQVDGERLLVRWPTELAPEEQELMSALAARLSYLGRAESWTSARLVGDPEAPFETRPCEAGVSRGPDWEQVSLLAAVAPSDYAGWRAMQVERELAALPEPSAGPRKSSAKALAKVAEQRARAIEPFPEDVVACLGVDTAWLQARGWSQPPGSRRVLYWRRRDDLEVSPPKVMRRPKQKPIEAVLLALATATRGRGALPNLLRVFPQALGLHRALASRAKVSVAADTRRQLLGKGESGGAAHDDHRHAHLLPLHLDPSSDQRIDHMLVWAPGCLGGEALRLVRALPSLHATGPTDSRGEVEHYRITVVGEGALEELVKVGEPLRTAMERVLGRGADGRIWRSVTPFFAPRFIKTRGKNTLEGQVRAELAARGLPGLRRIELFGRDELVRTRFLHYVRRDRSKAPKVDIPFGLELELEAPVPGALPGPLCLGFGSHFGLGRFEAV